MVNSNKKHTRCTAVRVLLSLAMVLSAGALIAQNSSQSPATTPMPVGPERPVQPYASPGQHPPDDITRQELAQFDSFLDNHPEVAQQLERDPSLINNTNWVGQHPELQAFLQNHPRLTAAFRDDPSLFMKDEERYDRRADRRDAAEMARFLDTHPEIAEQLRRDPSLIDNRKWVAEHPALQDFLKDHPQVAQEFRGNPNAFMQDENRDLINRGDIAEMNRFLDAHPEIAEQLHRNPSLIDDRKWVAEHPALQSFLQDHQQMAQAFRIDPSAFMRDEERYDHNGDRSAGNGSDRDDRYRGELSSFGQFLGAHSSIASELSANPSLANNQEYLATHADLNEYLQAHPDVSQQLQENPQGVMSSNLVQENGGFSTTKSPGPKPKSGSNQ
jgi:hypothetical protein